MRSWFKAEKPQVTMGELHALADRMLDGCKSEYGLRAAMLRAQRDRYALWHLRPRLFDLIAAVHGEHVAACRVATLDEWIEANEMGMPCPRGKRS